MRMRDWSSYVGSSDLKDPKGRSTRPASRGITRRRVIETAAAAGVAATVGPFVLTRPARAATTLKILQWNHFVPAYDKWFNETYVKEWGAANDTEVVVDNRQEHSRLGKECVRSC